MELGKVLFVDDEPDILATYRRGFRGDFNLEVAENAREGLEKLERQGPFSVVVSDLKMPGLSGIEFLKEVKTRYPDTVRIMLTGYADLDTAIETINKGDIFRFLTKPIAIDILREVVIAGLVQHSLNQGSKELHALRKMQQSMEGIILGFSQVVEIRDPYTAGHQRRVAQLAVAIAEQMGLDEDRCTGLRLAALVHDLGKVSTPSEFLNKPGKLSDLEFSIIKTHPEVARDILKSVDFTWPISTMVFQHHERLDGSGYPQGLKGREILLEARIIAVADVVEAISSHRPYRPSLGLKKALDEIRTNKDGIYDPDVAQTCLNLFEQAGFQFEGEGKRV